MPRIAARSPSQLTRAAIFATALASPACWTGNASVAPNDVETKHGAPNDVGTKQVVADPPTDPDMGNVVLVVVANKSTPISGRSVYLRGSGQPPREGRTDGSGVVTFLKLPPGNYSYETHDGHPRHGPEVGSVVVTAGQTARATIDVYVQPYNPHATPMPYGAPPARRRMV